MKRRERHCLRAASQSKPKHDNSYCPDHCFLLGQSDALDLTTNAMVIATAA
jgi:hypothetical protein